MKHLLGFGVVLLLGLAPATAVQLCPLDVDENGQIEGVGDGVFIFRGLLGLTNVVPPLYYVLVPSIPPQSQVAANVGAMGGGLDVDQDGNVNGATDGVYVYRHLLGLQFIVPTSFRTLDPSILPDSQVGANVDALCAVPTATPTPTATMAASATPTKPNVDIACIGSTVGAAGGSGGTGTCYYCNRGPEDSAGFTFAGGTVTVTSSSGTASANMSTLPDQLNSGQTKSRSVGVFVVGDPPVGGNVTVKVSGCATHNVTALNNDSDLGNHDCSQVSVTCTYLGAGVVNCPPPMPTPVCK